MRIKLRFVHIPMGEVLLAFGTLSEASAANPLDTWTPSNPLPLSAGNLLAVAYGNCQFAAVGLNSSVLTSSNGVDWIQRQSNADGDFRGIAYGNGRFVAVGWAPLDGPGVVVTSTDGMTWSQSQLSPHVFFNITYGNGKFVAFGPNFILTSTNGTDWFRTGSGANAIAFGDGKFVTDSETSVDGGTWISDHQIGTNWVHGIAFGNGQFVAVADDETNLVGKIEGLARILTSADGVNWVPRLASNEYALLGISYAGGQFVAVGYTVPNGDGVIVTSGDGVNWVQRQSPQSGPLTGITFGNGHFVAVGDGGTILESGDFNAPSWSQLGGRVIAWGDFGEAQARMPTGLTNAIAISSSGFNIPAFAEWSESSVLEGDGNLINWGYDPGFSGGFTNSSYVANAVALSQGGIFVFADGSVGVVYASPITNAVAAAMVNGRSSALVLKADGTVAGFNEDLSPFGTPAGLSNVVAIAIGGEPWSSGGTFSVALKDDGTLTAWGANDFGQIEVPRDLSNVVGIAAGYSHALALRADGTVVTWGAWSDSYPLPDNLSNVVAISAAGLEGGIDGYALALRSDGTVVAWGSGATDVPANLANVIAISAGPYRALALVGDAPPRLHAPMANTMFGPNGFSCSIPSECGKVYRLEYKDTLADDTWHSLPLVAGNGRLLSLKDPTAVGEARFYRVRRW